MHRKLAELLKTRKGKFTLFLGAGTSLTSGGKTTRELAEDVMGRSALGSHDLWDSFCNFLRWINEKERVDIFSKYFEGMNPSPGYEILANLIKEGYFRLVLTTNFDFMLEEALIQAGLVPNKDYSVCVVGAENEDILIKKVEDNSMIRIVKLHGDYKTGILPLTEEEPFTCEDTIKTCLNRLTKEGIIFVGYSAMDRDIVTCLPPVGGSVWWVNPKKVTADTTIAQENPDEYVLNERFYHFFIDRESRKNFIWGNHGKSDIFFKNIAIEIFRRDINGFCDQFKFGATRYRKMKDLFEPPYQYEEMKQKLEKYRIVLILGEPHLGKTYTALNILYDYYVEGVQVMYRSELKIKDVHHEILYEWEKLLTPGTVLYVEDPFGKTEPEHMQVFREELESIIQRIQHSKSMVIMTSRLNVFKEVGDPDDFPMIVELMKKDKSYDLGKRMKMIDNYAAVYKPAWRKLLNESVNGGMLREYIAQKLTEPHTIDILFEKSLEIDSMDVLLGKVEESKEILKAFREEIERSSTAEKIFFYGCYIFERELRGFMYIKRVYPVILRDFGFDPYETSFESLLRKYDFRVETYEGFFGSEIKFSHPEFSKAVEESFNTNSSIIGRVLFDLARDKNEYVRETAAETVRDNFEKLTGEYRRLLFDLARDKDRDVRKTVAETVRINFDKLTREYRRILFDLAKDKDRDVRKTIADTVRINFDKLTGEYRRLLSDLAKDKDVFVRMAATRTVGPNFDKLTGEYRRLLFDLAKDDLAKDDFD